MPKLVEALERAEAFHQAGDEAAAERCYRDILAVEPRQFGAMHGLGLLEAQRGRYEDALRLVQQALEIEPQSVAASITYGNVLQALNRPVEALAIWNEILKSQPDSAMARYNRGNVLQELNRHAEALDDYDQVLMLMPDNAPALYNRGCVLQHLQRHQDALASFDRMLELVPENISALHNRGVTLQKLGRYQEALATYERAFLKAPDDVEVLTNRGVVLSELKRWEDALASYDQALAIMPGYAEAWNNRANVLMDLRRPADALASWGRAVAIRPDFAEVFNNCGPALVELQRHTEAIASYEKALELDPDYAYLYGTWLHTRMQICDWTGVENHLIQLAEKIKSNEKVCPPFFMLALSDSLYLQKKAAEIWVNDKYPKRSLLPGRPGHAKHDKIRLGYFSADFREHPVADLTARLFEIHDRSHFELTAFSFGPDTQDPARKRLAGAFDAFIDVRNKSDQEVAALARQLEIDIAIDLGGFTVDSRTSIFAMRAAPLQINFLGYPATMGADYMDYIFADTTLIPASYQEYYAEKVAYLPSYQPNDPTRVVSDRDFIREALGLPRAGFVFCCFNNHYKITPQVFDSWVRILKQVEGSVLWLSAGNPAVQENLKKEAARRGLAPYRLIFAERVPLRADHLARHRCADLFIDTVPYNAHTTASDALWAGVPVLTCMGTTFAGRVAASLVSAAGMAELITQSSSEYEALAVKLAKDPALLGELKAKLARNRTACPLFDADRYRRHIEAAYITMWERHLRGEPPESFAVRPIA